MDFVQRKDIPLDSVINYSGDASNAVLIRTLKIPISTTLSGTTKTVVQSYLNADEQYRNEFIYNNIPYCLYMGIYHTTDEFIDEVSGETITEPDYITGVSAFILNLEDLSIYKTFYNTEGWLYTQKGYGNILAYSYDMNNDKLVIVTNQDGYGSSDGAYTSITKIGTDGVRHTQYLTISDSTDYTYRKVTAVTYSSMDNYFYMALSSYDSNKNNYTTKIIATVNYNEYFIWYYPIYTSSEDMKNISSLWGNYMNMYIRGLLLYKTTNDEVILRNIESYSYINLYGMPDDLVPDDFGIDAGEDIYVNCKASSNDTEYNIYAINKNHLGKTLIIQNVPDPITTPTSRKWNYLYNRKLCWYGLPYVIKSLQDGTQLGYNYDCNITNNTRNVYGIVKLNDFIAKGMSNVNDISITTNTISSYTLIFKAYEYSSISTLPIKYDLCIVGVHNSSGTNSIKTEKYNSIPITNSSDEETSAIIEMATQSTRRILGE